jgi:hypothetical protein
MSAFALSLEASSQRIGRTLAASSFMQKLHDLRLALGEFVLRGHIDSYRSSLRRPASRNLPSHCIRRRLRNVTPSMSCGPVARITRLGTPHAAAKSVNLRREERTATGDKRPAEAPLSALTIALLKIVVSPAQVGVSPQRSGMASMPSRGLTDVG